MLSRRTFLHQTGVIDSARTSLEAETETTESFSETAEAVLALYAAHGVDYIFINPGTDTFPLQEAYARRMELGLGCRWPCSLRCAPPPRPWGVGRCAWLDVVLAPI